MNKVVISGGLLMSAAKIAISINHGLLERLDRFIARKKFKTRSQAVQIAIANTLERLEHQRLAQECAKLDFVFEQHLAEEGIDEDIREWPDF